MALWCKSKDKQETQNETWTGDGNQPTYNKVNSNNPVFFLQKQTFHFSASSKKS